jgi:hypothetical protein
LKVALGGALLLAFLAATGVARAEDDAACQASYVAGQRRYKLDHDLLGGREQLLICAKTCPDELRASCGKWLSEIDAELPSIVVKAKDADGRDELDGSVEIDGKIVFGYITGTPIECNPGEHTVRVLRPHHAPAGEAVLLHAGEKLRVVDVWTEPRRAPVVVTRRPIPVASYVLAGVGAAALTSFGVFAIWTTVEYDQSNGCKETCPASSRDTSFTTKTVIADASLGVAAASLVTATVFFLTRPIVTERVVPKALVVPWAAPGGGGVAWSTRF